jgi:O-antigen ligase
MRALLSRDRMEFAGASALLLLLLTAVAMRSVLLGIAAAALVGMLMLVLPLAGTRRGNVVLVSALLVVTFILPSSIVYAYRIPALGGGITVVDCLYGLLLASWVIWLLTDGAILPSRLNLPLLVFLVWMVVAAVIGRQHGNDLKLILQDFRPLAYYGMFWIVASITTRRTLDWWLKLLGAGLVLNFLFGLALTAMGQGRSTGFVQEGVSRFPAPNDHFLMGAVLIAALLFTWPHEGQRRPRVLWVLLALCLAGLGMSLVRGYWLGVVAGMLYLLLVMRTNERVRMIAGVSITVAMLASAAAVVRPALVSSIATRGAAVTAVQDPNVQWRLIENRAVLAQVRAHPLTGNGLGQEYLFDFSAYGVKPYYKSYIHNNYLWLAQRMGAVGVCLFVWVVLAFLFPRERLNELRERADPWQWGLIVGARALIVADLVVSVTSPQFVSSSNIVPLAVVLAMAEAARVQALRQGEQEPAGVE